MNYQEAFATLYGLQRFGIRLGLDNILRLAEAFGHPECAFRSVHVAGTNGKGSTAAFVNGILQAAGYRVGLYTSPHLLDLGERFLVNGRPIREEELGPLILELNQVIDQVFSPSQLSTLDSPPSSPTFFEAVTALAFLHFARRRVEWGVIEVGLGGRYDATNILHTDVSVITNIGLEHQEHLGDSLESIAREKAGIIRAGGTVVTAAQEEALNAIARIAREKTAHLVQVQEGYRWEHMGRSEKGETFRLKGRIRDYDLLHIPLQGRHQILNAVTAVAVAEVLEEKGVTIGDGAIQQGLRETRWPGRLQLVSERPRILVDGAHNPPAIRVVRAFLEEERIRPVVLVFGVLKDKDWETMLREMAPLTEAIILTRPESDRGADPEILVPVASRFHQRVEVAETMREALTIARSLAAPHDTILVTGSLYTAAAALRALGFTSLF